VAKLEGWDFLGGCRGGARSFLFRWMERLQVFFKGALAQKVVGMIPYVSIGSLDCWQRLCLTTLLRKYVTRLI
jgi:hypothetical protein